MNQVQFYNQKEAIEYFGHSWSWIKNHCKVRRFISGRGYEIVKN